MTFLSNGFFHILTTPKARLEAIEARQRRRDIYPYRLFCRGNSLLHELPAILGLLVRPCNTRSVLSPNSYFPPILLIAYNRTMLVLP